MNQKTVIFIGRSGCGKGTQGKLLDDYFKKIDSSRDTLYIQVGQEFRDFIKGTTDTQKISRNIYDAGGLQPEFLAVYMWVNVLVKRFTKNEHIIIDGTPRKLHEAGVLNSIFSFYGLGKPIVFNIDISKEESINRLLVRGRIDDNRKDIEERLSWYETEVVPAIDYYIDNDNYFFHKIDGNKSIQNIHEEIISLL